VKDYKEITDLVIKELGFDFSASFEEPKNLVNGDISTNLAMKNARIVKTSPQELARRVVERMNEHDLSLYNILDVTIAGPGFINYKLSNKHFHDLLKRVLDKAEGYGRNEIGKGKTVNVEYVSANPTGPLHMGHGRNAAMGDSIANLYEWNGYSVTKEYYFNNAGNQMNNLGKSIYSRYAQLVHDPDFPFPEDGYHGSYIKDIANEIIENHGNSFVDSFKSLDDLSVEDLERFREIGEKWNFKGIKKTLTSLGIEQDVFYNEDSLYKEGKIEAVIDTLRQKELAYDKDDAVWLRLSEMGQDQDRVIVKKTGEPTYRLPDIAYHIEKFERGFDIIVDVFGSDHIATIPDVMSAVSNLGYDTDKIIVVIHQFVTLTQEGQQVKMSKRSGQSYTLDEIIQEVGPEVTRFFLLMRSGGTHLEFDIALAKEQSDKNPVFYLQYAHARICSIFTQLKEKGLHLDTTDVNSIKFSCLEHPSEINLIREIAKFEYVVESSASKAEPHIVADYLRDVAGKFHSFYHDCRIIGQEEELAIARLSLAEATRTVLKNGLAILGISAPEKM